MYPCAGRMVCGARRAKFVDRPESRLDSAGSLAMPTAVKVQASPIAARRGTPRPRRCLAFHCTPAWYRMRWVADYSPCAGRNQRGQIISLARKARVAGRAVLAVQSLLQLVHRAVQALVGAPLLVNL